MSEKPTTQSATPITVAYGDGIGPEIMTATLRILEEAGARLDKEVITIGKEMYEKGYSTGISEEAWASLERTSVFLKAPITTPRGGGYKSLNVTIRKTLGLYANVRPVMALDPFVRTKHPKMDLVIIRENEEDTYAGIEHRQTDEVYQCLKLISRPGCERICRYAFEYARKNGRKKVSCMVKDNIMKLTDGVFHEVFKEIAEEYHPDIQTESWIIDIGAARLADTPEIFDVLVMPNLYGDILSDIAAQISGSVGLGGSANIGETTAMFEAIHGSAPDIAGKGVANPSGLLLGAVLMLNHIGQNEVAERIHNAWLRTVEEGIHTGDIYQESVSTKRANTEEFTTAVIERLGKSPERLAPVSYAETERMEKPEVRRTKPARAAKELMGVDVFVECDDRNPENLARKLQAAQAGGLELLMITNRGVKVWPKGNPQTFCTDHWRCRYMGADRESPVVEPKSVVNLLSSLVGAGVDVIKTEHLYNFNGMPGYSLGQGQ